MYCQACDPEQLRVRASRQRGRDNHSMKMADEGGIERLVKRSQRSCPYIYSPQIPITTAVPQRRTEAYSYCTVTAHPLRIKGRCIQYSCALLGLLRMRHLSAREGPSPRQYSQYCIAGDQPDLHKHAQSQLFCHAISNSSSVTRRSMRNFTVTRSSHIFY